MDIYDNHRKIAFKLGTTIYL